MTLQEAQTQYSNIINSITDGMPSEELDRKADALSNLQDILPSGINGMEFNPISKAIVAIMPILEGQITLAVLKELQSSRNTMVAASNLIQQVGKKADSDARTLTFQKPKMVLAALNEAAAKVKEIRDAAKVNDFQQVGTKADALISLVETTIQSIKAT